MSRGWTFGFVVFLLITIVIPGLIAIAFVAKSLLATVRSFSLVPVFCAAPGALAVDHGSIYIEESGRVVMLGKNPNGGRATGRRITGFEDRFRNISGIAAWDHVVYATDFNDGSIKAIAVGADGATKSVVTFGQTPRSSQNLRPAEVPPHLPYKLATGANGALYAYYVSGGPMRHVRVFAPGIRKSVKPLSVIGDEQHPLCLGSAFAVDAKRRLYGLDGDRCGDRRSGDSIVRYMPSGIVEARIEGPKTTLANAVAIAVDAAGQIYVANRDAAQIAVFARDASGDVSPAYTLSLRPSAAQFVLALAVEPDGTLYVLSEANPRAAEFEFFRTGIQPTGKVAVFAPGAEGDAVAQKTISYGYTCRRVRAVPGL